MPAPGTFDLISDKGVKAIWLEKLEAVTSWAPKIAMFADSDQAVESYAGLTNVPKLREWIGGRQYKKISEKGITIRNRPFEASVEVTEDDRRRDKTGMLDMKIGQLALAATLHQEELISAFIAAGAASTYGTDYTGSNFFSDSHTMSTGNVNDNNISVDISTLPTGDTTGSHGSTTAPSVGEMALSIQQGVQAFYGFVDSAGRPMNRNLKTFMIMVPTTLLAVAQTAIMPGQMAQGMTNPIAAGGNSFEVVANPLLNAWTAQFAIFATGDLVKPFIVQTEQAPRIQSLVEGSDWFFQNKSFLYGVDWQGYVGYFGYDKAVLVTMT